MQNKEKRYFLIDGIRGAAIINMVLFHFLYDIFIVYERNPLWYDCMPIHIWQQIICWTFIFISGFVWTWGIKSNLQRGIFFNICGLIFSILLSTHLQYCDILKKDFVLCGTIQCYQVYIGK